MQCSREETRETGKASEVGEASAEQEVKRKADAHPILRQGFARGGFARQTRFRASQ